MRKEIDARRTLVVDGETFTLTVAGPSYNFSWTTGPNRGYGFGGTLAGAGSTADRSLMLAELLTDEEATKQIRSFLDEIDPATGYLRD